jgi:SAM-dependent methyltransferase
MNKSKECPACKSSKLEMLKQMHYTLPDVEERDSATGELTSKYERLSIYFNKIQKNGNSAEFNIMLCNSCGLIFLYPRFSAEEIREKYKIINDAGSANDRCKGSPAQNTEERSKRICSLLSGYGKCEKILDYGGAQGNNLKSFVEAKRSCHLTDYVHFDTISGVSYMGEDESSLKSGDSYDAILLCHVLEHAAEPVQLMRNISAYLSENGLLYVEVPLGCFNEWKWLDEPLTHLNFFSEESVQYILKKSGLDVIHISTELQWVTHGLMWCVNAIGRKSGKGIAVKCLSTRKQMMDPHGNIIAHLNRTIAATISIKGVSGVLRFALTHPIQFIKKLHARVQNR